MHVPVYIRFILKVAVASLLLMMIFRITLFFLFIWSLEGNMDIPHTDLLHTIIMGLRFDGVISAYILIIPFLLLGMLSFFTDKVKPFSSIVLVYLIVVYSIVSFILCLDIPYFLQFSSRLNTGALLWINYGEYMLGMILQEWSFLIYFILFVALVISLSIYLTKLVKKYFNDKPIVEFGKKKKYLVVRILSFLILGVIIVATARGRLDEKSPIRMGTAYFSNNQSLNKLALNPVFTFIHSLLVDRKNKGRVNLMDNEEALILSTSLLSLKTNDSVIIETRNGWQNFNGNAMLKKNVVIIIMESMSSFKLGKYNGPVNLTPKLDSIISNSLYFDNIYTAGIHTFNGIYSTLFSFPALLNQQPLEDLMEIPHTGIAQVLADNGYSTSYFATHDPQFDNVSGFLKANGYENVYADYPDEWKLSTNGVPDHIMFDSSIPILDDKSENNEPFFAVFMTSSDHKPHIIPGNISFTPFSKSKSDQIVEYADWSIGRFFEQASKQPWYDNTIFVLVADHGQNMGHTYDMPLAFHSTPLIISSSYFTSNPDTLRCLGGQIDIAPTILGLLNIPYSNNTMGIDLFENKRPFMYFSADDKIGCLDNNFYLIMRPDSNETLYMYDCLSTVDYYDENSSKVDSMKQYTYSMMQATQYIHSSKNLFLSD